MAEYIKKWPIVDKLTALENELQQYKPFRHCEYTMYRRICDIEIEIGKMDAEDVAPVVHGKWDSIPNTYMCVAGKDGSYHGCATSCSVCHEINPNAYKTNYCPNCGAKMDLEEQNEAKESGQP